MSTGGEPVLIGSGEVLEENVPGISDPLFTDLGPNTQVIVNGTNVLSNGLYLYQIDGANVIEAAGKLFEMLFQCHDDIDMFFLLYLLQLMRLVMFLLK